MPTSPYHHSPTPSTSSTASLTLWTSRIPHIFRSTWKYWFTPTPPTSPLLWDGPISPFSWQIWSELLGGTPPSTPAVVLSSSPGNVKGVIGAGEEVSDAVPVPAFPDAVCGENARLRFGAGEDDGVFETALCSPASASYSVSCRIPASPVSISASSPTSQTPPTSRIPSETASIIAALSHSDNKIKYSQLHAFEATWSAKWQVFTCPFCYPEAFKVEDEE